MCDRCVHQQRVATSRSTYSLCLRSRADPRYAKYPPIPVIRCAGYQQRDDDRPA